MRRRNSGLPGDSDWSFSVHVNDWSTKQLGWYNQNTVYYRDLLRDPYFLVRAWEHYKKIRQTVIAPMIAPGGFLDQAIEKLEVPGIAITRPVVRRHQRSGRNI